MTSAARWTKGQWTVDAKAPACEHEVNGRVTIRDDKGGALAFMAGDNRAANAALIASAPDLAEALQNAIGYIEGCIETRDEDDLAFKHFNEARAALAAARAEGGES